MNEYPKISVISIIYKVEPFLRECIDSMINQTYPNLEIVLVVGTGGDGSLDIAQEYVEKDERIKLVICEPKGTGDARNRGLETATGDYIGFVDGDDYASPEMFEKLFSLIKEHQADIAVCGKYSEYPDHSEPDPPGEILEMTSRDAFEMILKGTGFFFHCWDKLFKAELFDGVLFPTDRYLEDRYVVNLLLERSDRIVYDRTPLYHFRIRSDSLSRIDEMSEHNTAADEDFVAFVLERYPELASECEAFLMYDHITCIQNRLLHNTFTKEISSGHLDYIRSHRKSIWNNPCAGRRVKIKTLLSLYFRPGLKALTEHSDRKAKRNAKFSIS
ncbi:MAG: glycosyltransferase [Lachnospiraceae bacterium]|nr:glycosyltransferase [Lachnospiraceae bacterium]